MCIFSEQFLRALLVQMLAVCVCEATLIGYWELKITITVVFMDRKLVLFFSYCWIFFILDCSNNVYNLTKYWNISQSVGYVRICVTYLTVIRITLPDSLRKNTENVLFAKQSRMQKCFLLERPCICLSYRTNHDLIHSWWNMSQLRCSPVPRKVNAVLNLHGVSLFQVLSVIALKCLIHLKLHVTWKCFFKKENFSFQLTLCFRTVVKCNIAKSQALYSAQRGLKTNNAAVFKVGAIMINIPQHPATLHSMMVRSSHQLSKQISDLIRQPSNVYVHFISTLFKS